MLDVGANIAEVRHQASVKGLRILIILSWAQWAAGEDRTAVDSNGNLPSSFNAEGVELQTSSKGRSAQNLKITNPVRPGPNQVIVCHLDGSRTVYRAHGDTDRARGNTLLQAEARSVAGELVAIGEGAFELQASLVTKTGQTVNGAGVDLTRLRWAPLMSQPSSAVGTQLVGNNYFTQTDGVTVRGMTIDCNAQNHAAGIGTAAVILNGSNCLIEDIKVINPGRTDLNECFPVAIFSGESTVRKTNAHIRRVEVTQPAAIMWRDGLSALLIGGVYYDSSIEDCYVHDIDVGDSSGTVLGKPRYVHACGMSGSSDGAPACKHALIAHNRAVNLTGTAGAQGAAIYTDTGSVEGYEIVANELINVMRGIHLHEGTFYNEVRILRNKIRFLSELASTGGIKLTPHAAANFEVADNDIREQNIGKIPASDAIEVGRVRNIAVRNNVIHMTGNSHEIYIHPRNTNVLTVDNHRADGSPIRDNHRSATGD